MRRAGLFFLLCSSACSWSRFDDVVENSPTVLLNKPKEIASGFGSSLAVASRGGSVMLLVGGAPLREGAVEFDLGLGDDPTLDAGDAGHCRGSDLPCFLSPSPAALTRAQTPDMVRDLCFVNGAGAAADGTGVVVRCVDNVEYHLDVPEPAAELLEFALDSNQPVAFRFASDDAVEPGLLATADAEREEERVVWYYPPLSRSFYELPPPAGIWPENTPRTLQIANVGDTRLLAVGTAELGEVRLYRTEGDAAPEYLGCLGTSRGFGRALAAGPVLPDDDADELVVSDDQVVYVFDGAKLNELVPTASADCSLAALPEGALVTSFTCGSTKNISGCETSDFGAALGVGDLDGDGDGEVVVGAPGMTVRHVSRAGALILYDVEEPRDSDLEDIAFISSAEQDDQLGRTLVLPPIGGRHIIAAGGNSKVALFYCPAFLPAELEGPRCLE
jgi:hypothetical protein